MPRRPLIWPFAGRSDQSAEADQPAFTTRAARNVRNRRHDGRITGARRFGMEKFNASAIGTGRIKGLISTAIDDRKLVYGFSAGAESVLWDEPTPSKSDCLDGKADAFGNVYALDGNAGIVKFNSAGVEILKIALPVADPSHIVRALWVDEAGRIFAGVSAGGDVRTARVFCVLQLQDNEYTVLWQIEPGAYTEELRVYRGSQLYAAQNDPGARRARVVVYESIGLDPIEAKRFDKNVAFPIHGFDVSAEGDLYVASGPLSFDVGSVFAGVDQRPGPPAYFTQPLVGWTPRDDSTLTLWSWFDPSDERSLGAEDVEDAELLDGKQILRWRDLSGKNRDWYAGSLTLGATEAGPEYLTVGIGGLPSIRFDTGRTATVKHSLVSLPNASVDVNFADQQRTPVPAYAGAMWCLSMVLRPSTTGTNPLGVLALPNQAAGASNHVLFVNRNAQAANPGVAATGFVSYFADTAAGDPGAGAGGQSLGYDYLTDSNTRHLTGAFVLTVLWDGGVEGGDTTKTRCLFRVNGRAIDRFEGEAFSSLLEQFLGMAATTVGAIPSGTDLDVNRRFRGEIGEWVLYERHNRDALTEPKVVTHDQLETTGTNAAQTDNQVTRTEGYLAYKWGIARALVDADPALVNLRLTHPYGRRTDDALMGPPAPVVGGFFEAHQIMLLPPGLVAKYDGHGLLKWASNRLDSGGANAGVAAVTSSVTRGYGYGVRARKIESDGKTHVWVVGPTDGGGGADTGISVRKLIDTGSTFSEASADGAWTHQFTSSRSLDYAYPRMAADAFGNLYLPYFETGAAAEWSLLIFKKDPDGGGLAQILVDFLLSASQQAHAVAIPPDSLNPDYRTDLATKMAEHVYIFTRNESVAANPTVHKLRLVNVTVQATGSPREIVTLAMVEDDIRRITASTNVVPTGGSAAFDATAQWVQMIRCDDDIVILDGVRYLAYKLRDGVVEALEATSAGELPPRAKLAMCWRHRLVLGNFADRPNGYAASKLGNIRDWNLRPGALPTGEQIQTATQAFTGTITRAGEAEDTLVAMIPVWDDLAYLIGESKILRLTGDPQDGGQIHLVTDSMGGTFGDSWCKDAQGRVFMFGNRPRGLYQLLPDRDPIPLTRHSLEQTEFEDIDLSTHRMVLAWDPLERGVRIFQVSWASPSTIVAHWFWEENTHRAVKVPPVWQDRIGAVGKQPTAVAYLGGDDSQGLLIGCEDGLVRMFTAAARDDDGTPIDAFVVMEATQGMPEKSATRLREVSIVLADDLEGARLELFASETAGDIGAIQDAVDLRPGRNQPFRSRIKGRHIWCRLRSNSGRWAFEEGSCDLVPAGKARQRLS